MTRKLKNFNDNPEFLKQAFTEDTWCEVCKTADLGLNDPIEYEEDEKHFIEGKCRKCGNRVVSEVITKDVESSG